MARKAKAKNMHSTLVGYKDSNYSHKTSCLGIMLP